jgi:hypothetical protein
MAREVEPRALRLMIFDRTCRGRRMLPGLSHAWSSGAMLYRALGRLDACRGVGSWDEALAWLADFEPGRPIAEVQYWGHGRWGSPRVACQALDLAALRRGRPLRAALDRVAQRMLPSERGMFWFRTCETFGAHAGHEFARDFADAIGCRAAGHTYIIGHWQSGLHSLLPGQQPAWSPDEALIEGTALAPERAAWSRARAPNTITFLHGRIPDGY